MQCRSGRRRVLCGGNYPLLLHQQAPTGVDSLGLDDESRELFLGGNAERLLRLPQRATL